MTLSSLTGKVLNVPRHEIGLPSETYRRTNRMGRAKGGRSWDTITKAHFSGLVEDPIRRELGVSRRNDVVGATGMAQRGWKGLAWK